MLPIVPSWGTKTQQDMHQYFFTALNFALQLKCSYLLIKMKKKKWKTDTIKWDMNIGHMIYLCK